MVVPRGISRALSRPTHSPPHSRILIRTRAHTHNDSLQWANGSDHGDRAFLQNLTEWNWSVNDADACDNGTHTFFIYGQCAQTAPKNFTGKSGNFYQLGIAQGTTPEWLASYYP